MNHAATLRYSSVLEARRNALRLIELASRIRETVDTWVRRHQTRRQFAGVDARILRDCGISEADRFIEVNKPFWRS